MKSTTNREGTMQATQTNAVRTNGGRLESYEVKCSANLGSINWPTGFSGGGWALLTTTGDVVSRHAFRVDALRALIALDGLDCEPEDIAGDLTTTPGGYEGSKQARDDAAAAYTREAFSHHRMDEI